MQMKKTLVFLAALSTVGIACAGTIATPHISGDFEGWTGTGIAMTDMGSDVWSLTLTGYAANERHEFKVTDGSWTTSLPSSGNSWFYADGSGNITITYDGNTYSDGWSPSVDRIGLTTDPGAWTVAGDFQHLLGGGDWNNADANTAMTPLGGGIYSLTLTDLAAGSYIGKPVASGSWDAIGSDNRSANADNFSFTTDAINNDVVFTVDAYNGIAKVEVIPEPATLGLITIFGLGLIGARRFMKI